jgi:hypothetical protein
LSKSLVPEVGIDMGWKPRGILSQFLNSRRFPIIFKDLEIKYLQQPIWKTLGRFGLFSVSTVTFWLHIFITEI